VNGGRPPGPAAQAVPYLTADDVATVTFPAAVDAVHRALMGGLDVAAAPARTNVPVRAGHLLLMPGEVGDFVGVKVASVAPDNPARGKPRIQGSVLLMDAASLAPVALIDGIALTALRTPAVSAAAVQQLRSVRPARVVVFGAGPQAAGHITALRHVVGIDDVAVIARHSEHAARLTAKVAADLQIPARVGHLADLKVADIVVCATTARTPLFAAADLRAGAIVVAVGSHEPDVAELDPDLLAGAQVVVEDPATALREAGDIVLARSRSKLDAADLVPLASIVRGEVAVDTARTRVFKSVGMAWEDVVVAAEVYRARVGRRTGAATDG
jgi:ornithine cyclodeaminase